MRPPKEIAAELRAVADALDPPEPKTVEAAPLTVPKGFTLTESAGGVVVWYLGWNASFTAPVNQETVNGAVDYLRARVKRP